MPLATHHPPVRVALVGLGGHGRTIQHAAEAVEGVKVVGVFDVDPAEGARGAGRFGCPAAPTYEAVLATPGLDAVALVTPNRLHRAQAEAAFAAGLDVLVEKPIAHTVADGAAIVAAAEAAGRVLMVGHNMRYAASALEAARRLAAGDVGAVVAVEVHFSSDNGRRLPAGSWRLRPEEAPLLPVAQLGIHALDLVHALVGPVEAVSAFARTVSTPPGVVDSVVATLRLGAGALGGGVLGTLQSHYCTPVRFAWTITGTDGALVGTPHTLVLERTGAAPEPLVDVREDGFESYVRQIEVFAEAVRTRVAPSSDGRSGLRALAVVEALAASAAAGGAPVRVADGPAPP